MTFQSILWRYQVNLGLGQLSCRHFLPLFRLFPYRLSVARGKNPLYSKKTDLPILLLLLPFLVWVKSYEMFAILFCCFTHAYLPYFHTCLLLFANLHLPVSADITWGCPLCFFSLGHSPLFFFSDFSMGRPLKIVSFAKVLCKAARPLVPPPLISGPPRRRRRR